MSLECTLFRMLEELSQGSDLGKRLLQTDQVNEVVDEDEAKTVAMEV